jgi:hypothetical protein
MVSDPASTITKTIFTQAHDSLIKTAYNMFLDKPIFGHGPKMFRVICKNEKYAEELPIHAIFILIIFMCSY